MATKRVDEYSTATPADADQLLGIDASDTTDSAAGTVKRFLISAIKTAVTSLRLDQFTAPTANVSMNSNKITNVTDPTGAQDAATKAYVDGVAQGLSVKQSCRLATAAALPANTYLSNVITGTSTGVLTVDGQTVALNDRILVKDQATAAHNGIYKCTTAGAMGVAFVLTRSEDMDAGSEVPGAFAFVEEGTANTGKGFVVADEGPYTLGTTAIAWTQFSDLGTVTEANITFTDITTNNASTSKHGFLKKLSNVSTEFMNGQGAWATPASGAYDYILLEDQKSAGTEGGGFTSGAWRTRDINTEVVDSGSHASISSNQITLAAGTYRCHIICPAAIVGYHKARLYNITDSAVIVSSQNGYAQAADGVANNVSIIGQFTLAAQKTLEIQHQCGSTRATNGFGIAINGVFTVDIERYTIAQFWKIS